MEERGVYWGDKPAMWMGGWMWALNRTSLERGMNQSCFRAWTSLCGQWGERDIGDVYDLILWSEHSHSLGGNSFNEGKEVRFVG